MIGATLTLTSLLAALTPASASALPPAVPAILANVTALCQTPETFSACAKFSATALGDCKPSDLACQCGALPAITAFCGDACNFNATEFLATPDVLSSECAMILQSQNSVQAAGVLDRIRSSRRFRGDNDEEDETDEDERECNNGDDSDPGTNWMNYERRSLDDMTEVAVGQNVDVGDTVSLRDRLLIHGGAVPITANVVVKPDHSKLTRRDDGSDAEVDAAPEKADQSTVDCCDTEAARKQVVHDVVEAAGKAFSRFPANKVEKLVENVLSGLPSRKSPKSHGDVSEPSDETAEETSELAENTDDSEADTENETETDTEDDSEADDETEDDEAELEPVADEATHSSQIKNTSKKTHAAVPRTTSSHAVTAVDAKPVLGSTSTSTVPSAQLPLATVHTTVTLVPIADLEEPSKALETALDEQTPLTAAPAPSISQVLEPPSLTIARAFSLADEIAMLEEHSQDDTVQAASDEPEEWRELAEYNSEEGWEEIELASAFVSSYLSSALSKHSSMQSAARTTSPTAQPTAADLAAVDLVNGTANGTVADHLRGSENVTVSGASVNSNSTSTKHKPSGSHAVSGSVANRVPLALLAAGIYFAFAI